MRNPEAWRALAACKGMDASIFYPEVHGAGTPTNRLIAEAKAVCAHCPVRGDCLDWALSHRETEGVWGGLSASDRRRRRTDRLRLAARDCTVCGHPLPEDRRLIAIYCSPACRSTANTRRHRARVG